MTKKQMLNLVRWVWRQKKKLWIARKPIDYRRINFLLHIRLFFVSPTFQFTYFRMNILWVFSSSTLICWFVHSSDSISFLPFFIFPLLRSQSLFFLFVFFFTPKTTLADFALISETRQQFSFFFKNHSLRSKSFHYSKVSQKVCKYMQRANTGTRPPLSKPNCCHRCGDVTANNVDRRNWKACCYHTVAAALWYSLVQICMNHKII